MRYASRHYQGKHNLRVIAIVRTQRQNVIQAGRKQ